MTSESDNGIKRRSWIRLPKPIIMGGALRKKASKKVLGRHTWNNRYFVLEANTGCLRYYTSRKDFEGDKKPIGVIAVDRITEVKLLPNKKKRFNVVMEGDSHTHMFETKPALVQQWVEVLRDYEKAPLKKPSKIEADFHKREDIFSFKHFADTPFAVLMKPVHLRCFASFFTKTEYANGDELRRDEHDLCFYTLLSGSVVVKSKDGKAERTSTFHEGACFTLAADSTATAFATSPAVVFRLTSEDMDLYKTYKPPDAALRVVELVTGTGELGLKHSFFSGVPQIKLRDMLRGGMLRFLALARNEILYREGDENQQTMYFMMEGVCKAVYLDNTQQSKVLRSFGQDEFCGEITCLLGMPRGQSVVASTDVLLLEIHREHMDYLQSLLPNRTQSLLKAKTKENAVKQFRKYPEPFFKAIPEDKYHILARYCEMVEAEANHTVFDEGDNGDAFYLLAQGVVRVLVGPDQQEVAKIHAGKYFGEIALVQDTPRTASVVTDTKCVMFRVSLENFNKFFSEAPEAIADFEVKLARHNVSLRSVLYHPIGFEYFRKFLKNEYSEENILFWRACREFRHMKQWEIMRDLKFGGVGGKKELAEYKEDLYKEMQRIHKEFVDQEAPQQVNVDSSLRSALEAKIAKGSAGIDDTWLNGCQSEIEKLMGTDTFARFVKDTLFDQFLDDVKSYSAIDKVTDQRDNVKLRSGSTATSNGKTPNFSQSTKASHRRLQTISSTSRLGAVTSLEPQTSVAVGLNTKKKSDSLEGL